MNIKISAPNNLLNSLVQKDSLNVEKITFTSREAFLNNSLIDSGLKLSLNYSESLGHQCFSLNTWITHSDNTNFSSPISFERRRETQATSESSAHLRWSPHLTCSAFPLCVLLPSYFRAQSQFMFKNQHLYYKLCTFLFLSDCFVSAFLREMSNWYVWLSCVFLWVHVWVHSNTGASQGSHKHSWVSEWLVCAPWNIVEYQAYFMIQLHFLPAEPGGLFVKLSRSGRPDLLLSSSFKYHMIADVTYTVLSGVRSGLVVLTPQTFFPL